MTRLLKWHCPLGCGVHACHCWVPGCPATWEIVEGEIAQGEPEQMPGNRQNSIPSSESSPNVIVRGESTGNSSTEGV